MLLKQITYNEYLLILQEDGNIYTLNRNDVSLPFVSIADVPIIIELMKKLLEYYVKWLKNG